MNKMNHIRFASLEPLQGGLAIKARNLVKVFPGNGGVKGISIDVPGGAIYGLLGPNGAGKTTTIRMILGVIAPDSGNLIILGQKDPTKVANRLGYLPEERGLYASMKAIDAIAFMGAIRGMKEKDARNRGVEMLTEYGLEHAAGKRIKQLSKGMAQTVQIIGTLVHSPDLVILDEPFSGLDAINQLKLEDLIKKTAARGTTVIFSTHVIAHAERLCERVGIISGGRMRFSGTVHEARELLPSRVVLETRRQEGEWIALLPHEIERSLTKRGTVEWKFTAPGGDADKEGLLASLIKADAGVISMGIEKPGLHEIFLHVAGQ